MRLIGELKNDQYARVFSDYLTKLNIENQIIEESGGIYEIWVYPEDEVERSERLLEKFRENPDDPEYQGVSKIAKLIREQAKKDEKDGPIYLDARTTIFNRGGTPPRGGFTVFLVIVCIVVAVLSNLGDSIEKLRPIFITEVVSDGMRIQWAAGLPEVLRGEVWRIFTPIFIHFGLMHLIFNMLWLLDLGSMVEDRKGTLFLALFVLVVGGIGNLVQYQFSHPLFGGMSGVLYGLMGYIWMKGKYDPQSRLYLHPTTVMFMIIWYFLCLTGVMGHIANGAHTAGLVIGIAWGFFSSSGVSQLKRKFKL